MFFISYVQKQIYKLKGYGSVGQEADPLLSESTSLLSSRPVVKSANQDAPPLDIIISNSVDHDVDQLRFSCELSLRASKNSKGKLFEVDDLEVGKRLQDEFQNLYVKHECLNRTVLITEYNFPYRLMTRLKHEFGVNTEKKISALGMASPRPR